ncbi:MAG: protein kinase [Sandaracinaceae bacterium]|nr:protein kinase [Sandaracinaceae bacterium]
MSRFAPGQLVSDKFRVLSVLGEGAMGTVYTVEHQTLRVKLALKVLSPQLARRPDQVERFLREGVAISRVRHRAVVQVFDAGKHESQPWIAMELLEGETLRARMARQPLAAKEAAGLMIELLGGLAVAHAQGIVHRDVKPTNIHLAVQPDGTVQPKLLDFGIALVMDVDQRLTGAGMTMGTLSYMAPEQIHAARDVDARADIYAIGAILYEALSGRPPYQASSVNELIAAVAAQPPPDLARVAPHQPRVMAEIVSRCLAVDRDRRPRDAKQLVAMLDAAVRLPDEPSAIPATLRLPGSEQSAKPVDPMALTSPSAVHPGAAQAWATPAPATPSAGQAWGRPARRTWARHAAGGRRVGPAQPPPPRTRGTPRRPRGRVGAAEPAAPGAVWGSPSGAGSHPGHGTPPQGGAWAQASPPHGGWQTPPQGGAWGAVPAKTAVLSEVAHPGWQSSPGSPGPYSGPGPGSYPGARTGRAGPRLSPRPARQLRPLRAGAAALPARPPRVDRPLGPGAHGGHRLRRREDPRARRAEHVFTRHRRGHHDEHASAGAARAGGPARADGSLEPQPAAVPAATPVPATTPIAAEVPAARHVPARSGHACLGVWSGPLLQSDGQRGSGVTIRGSQGSCGGFVERWASGSRCDYGLSGCDTSGNVLTARARTPSYQQCSPVNMRFTCEGGRMRFYENAGHVTVTSSMSPRSRR